MYALLFETASKYLLLGFMPESIGLLIFGIALIAGAVGLRWIFNRKEEVESESFSANTHNTIN